MKITPCIVMAALTAVVTPLVGAKASTVHFDHPVLEHNIQEGNRNRLVQEVSQVMAMSEQQLMALVPVQTPLIKNACPACGKGKPWDKEWDYSAAKMFGYLWDPGNPEQIQCKACLTVFPNENFPENRTEVFYNMAGNPVEISYYFDPEKTIYGLPGQTQGKTGRKYFLDGVIDYAKWTWLFPKLEALAQLYHITKDEKYSRPAVVILNQYSRNFQDFLFVTDYGHTYATTKNRRLPYGWEDTRWGRRAPGESMDELLAVVDLLYGSKAMDQVSAEMDTDIRESLWKAFESGLIRRLHNGYATFFGQSAGAKELLPLAKVFGKTDLVHFVYQSYYDMPRYTFGVDGGFFEGTGYAAIQMLDSAKIREDDGYSDPPQVQGSSRLENLYPFTSRAAFYEKTYHFLDDMRYPDGRKAVVQDAAPFFSIFQDGVPRESSVNIMMPGYKHVVMGDGTGDEQVQVHVGFGENSANHSRQDTLGLQLYAFAHPLLDAFPYHKSKLRRFSEMTITHNTVVVDHENQKSVYSDADPLLYVDDLPGLTAFSADGYRAYRGVTSRYQRTVVLNTVDLKHPYVIDVFQVAGGKTHDYMIQSSSQFAQTAFSNLKMEPLPGERPLLPPGEAWSEPIEQRAPVGSGYGLFFDVQRAEASPYSIIDFVCDNPWDIEQVAPDKNGKLNPHEMKYVPYRFDPDAFSENAVVGTRHHIAGQAGQEVFLNQIPALNRNGFYGEETTPSEDWETMPQLMIRSEQKDGKSESLFVVVHEPIYKTFAITSVERVALEDPNVLMLDIRFKDGRRDRFVYSLNMEPVTVKNEDLEFSGIMGLVAADAAGKGDAYLIGGDQLKSDAVKVTLGAGEPRYTGHVTGSSRIWDADQEENSFTVRADIDLPEGDALAGQWIILKHHGSWDAYKDRKDIKRFPRDQKSRNWGLDDEYLWKTFYKGIQNVEPVERLKGGGHSFEIARIEKRDGRTIIHTRDDHGLIIKDGKTEEYFYPCRTFEGKTTFEIHSTASTQATPLVTPAGGVYMDAVDVACSVKDPANPIMVALTEPSGIPAETDWDVYEKPLQINGESALHVRSSRENTIREPKVFTYQFSSVLEAATVPGQLAPGLIRGTHLSGTSLDDGGLPNKVDIVTEVSADELVDVIGDTRPGKLVFSGFIRIDDPGIYTFHYLADRDGLLRIGERTLLESRPQYGAWPLARSAEVALENGIYPIHFELIVRGRFSYWDPKLKLEWSGPGFVRQEIPLDHLLHQPEQAEKAKAELDRSPVTRAAPSGGGGERPTMHRGTVTSVDTGKKSVTFQMHEDKKSMSFLWDDATTIELRKRMFDFKGLPESGLDAQLEALSPEQLLAVVQQKPLTHVSRVTIYQSRGELAPQILEQYKRIIGVLYPSGNRPDEAVLEVQGLRIPIKLDPGGFRVYRIATGTDSSFQSGRFAQFWTFDRGGPHPLVSKILLDD